MAEATTTGQWLAGPEGVRWFYDSGALCLDFGQPGLPVGEQFASPADLTLWLGERFARLERVGAGAAGATDATGSLGSSGSSGGDGERMLRDAVLLREAIARVAAALARGAAAGRAPARDDIDTINLFAATPDVPPVLAGGHRRAGAGRVRLAQALASVARDAVRCFGAHGGGASLERPVAFGPSVGEAPGRIRECEAEYCHYVFLDESRANNRRWCSMQRCGNRAKVRAHRARAAARG